MIPKVIHYCWFGDSRMPPLARRCIRSWKRRCPGYQFVKWNEHTFDLDKCPPYVREAYAAKMWAFVTDFVRLKVVYEHGGIYLDTDVELLRSLDTLLDNHAFFGLGDKLTVATGLGFGAEQGASILLELMEDYKDISFKLPDGSFDKTPCPVRNKHIFQHHGLLEKDQQQRLTDGSLILPKEYLCPLSYVTQRKTITQHTISIHWYSASWLNDVERSNLMEKQKENRRRLRYRQRIEWTVRRLNWRKQLMQRLSFLHKKH